MFLLLPASHVVAMMLRPMKAIAKYAQKPLSIPKRSMSLKITYELRRRYTAMNTARKISIWASLLICMLKGLQYISIVKQAVLLKKAP